MFTGIIEEIGKVERIQKDTCNCKLSIKASKILEDIHLGDSIAVNGICLTAVSYTHLDVYKRQVVSKGYEHAISKQ